MMTDEERGVINLLAQAWNAFVELPVEHPMDREDFCRMIHAAQDKILSRPARRELNDDR